MQIGQYKINPGENKEINLYVGALPTGTGVYVKSHIFRSQKPGPTMLVLAGMHGDEINGIEIVRQAIFSGLFDDLIAGTVIAIPVLNIYGFMNFSRYVPDGKDVNRSFPGSANGSLASRVAHMMTKKILPLVDFGIDFHTGGDSRFNYPQVRYTIRSEASRELATIFNAPVLLEKSTIAKTLRAEARSRKIPVIVYEGGESLRLDGHSIEVGLDGIKQILQAKSMLDPGFAYGARFHDFKRSTWIRAHQSGIFVWSEGSGRPVKKGDILGSIYNPNGTEKTTVVAHKPGFLIAHNNIPVVNIGDALFNLAY
ncbi:succinylglutamate desuccinylase/aspartoacylase family protein [Membranicola marinus]|uniref:Succinylglutamate desuccinylase/aspartoacylase family protein n=1 Tax=Membranihabitans marinus TaxID=1227546 RepID=A0A953HX85_9BACT|nr:succinylglutamate desuccinylase/aspartoacylase family protein [Membranihabitans marinus]MBY5959890.1 succinylglutamate desuccinylase/aspartoacylase family protein [Membranihabitans marinus]